MNEEELIPQPRFTGIFIPAEILEIKDLSYFEIMLLAWIDALYSKEKKGCFASNEYLAQKFGIKKGTIVDTLTNLRKKNLIEDVSFDGRHRVIRTCIGKVVEESQSDAAYGKNRTPPTVKTVPYMRNLPFEGTPQPYIEIKEERKEYREGSPARPPTFDFSDLEKVKESLSSLEGSTLSQDNISMIIMTINQTMEKLTLKIAETKEQSQEKIISNQIKTPKKIVNPKKKEVKPLVTRIIRRENALTKVETSEEEHQKLLDKYSPEFVEECYDELFNWKTSRIESDPKSVEKHTDYGRIIDWVHTKVTEKRNAKKRHDKFNPNQTSTAPQINGTEEARKCKILCDSAEEKLKNQFRAQIFFHAGPNEAVYVNEHKDIRKTYAYNAFTWLQLKERLRIDLSSSFRLDEIVYAKERAVEPVSNLIKNLSEKFRVGEPA